MTLLGCGPNNCQQQSVVDSVHNNNKHSHINMALPAQHMLCSMRVLTAHQLLLFILLCVFCVGCIKHMCIVCTVRVCLYSSQDKA